MASLFMIYYRIRARARGGGGKLRQYKWQQPFERMAPSAARTNDPTLGGYYGDFAFLTVAEFSSTGTRGA
ncbi:hypothetical protein M569_14855 [Genlisea aurea]|uniref:Uncharacterized protein n=1 Tax=Genlisea aurea TaxID=192259 RepID=S8C6C7_9LAMI|nr:hypothetical protein M569_14855 [Genlisea aurea]